MSVVIIGGNERMECQYKDICKSYGYSAKVFAKEKGALKKKLGCPNLFILFMGTVSHNMASSALDEARRSKIPVARVRSSSASALNQALSEHLGGQANAG